MKIKGKSLKKKKTYCSHYFNDYKVTIHYISVLGVFIHFKIKMYSILHIRRACVDLSPGPLLRADTTSRLLSTITRFKTSSLHSIFCFHPWLSWVEVDLVVKLYPLSTLSTKDDFS